MPDGSSPASALFDRCFDVTVGIEGGFGADPRDRGNWTGGQIGVGELKGTAWGISAASYPTLAIKNLSKDDAKAIYLRDFWPFQPARAGLAQVTCDQLPPELALLVFDAAANNGPTRAREWLQAALSVGTDGKIGCETMQALKAQTSTPDGIDQVCAEFLARRIDFMGLSSNWNVDGLGWARRLAALPWKAMALSLVLLLLAFTGDTRAQQAISGTPGSCGLVTTLGTSATLVCNPVGSGRRTFLFIQLQVLGASLACAENGSTTPSIGGAGSITVPGQTGQYPSLQWSVFVPSGAIYCVASSSGALTADQYPPS